MNRPIVAQADAARLSGGGRREPIGPLPVGIVRWGSDDERTTVVVKATYGYDPHDPEGWLSLAQTQRPFALALPSRQRGAGAHELEAPADLVRAKVMADVMVVGHAYAASASERVGVGVVIDDVMDRKVMVVGTASDRHPLTAGYLRSLDGETTSPIGPAGPWRVARAPAREVVELDLEAANAVGGPRSTEEEPSDGWSSFIHTGPPVAQRGEQFAAPEQRAEALPPGIALQLTGLMPGGGLRTLRLPEQRPVVIYESPEGSFLVEMVLDTALLDTDACLLCLTWRGEAPLRAGQFFSERIVVSLEEVPPRPLEDVMRGVQRGHFGYAVEEPDLVTPPVVDPHDPRILLARLSTYDVRPEPMLALDDYATVAAELSSAEDRAAVLGRHGLVEDTWLLEERAWLERIADAMQAGELDLPLRYSEALRAAQARAKPSPDEAS